MLFLARLPLRALAAFVLLQLLVLPTSAVPTSLSTRQEELHPETDLDLVIDAVEEALPTSKADLEARFFKAAPAKDKSCFFTGMDVGEKNPRQNTIEAKKQCKILRLTTLEGIWKKNQMLNQGQWKKPIVPQDWSNFLGWVSEIFADKTSGTAYLLIPGDIAPRGASIFYSIEFQAMKRSEQTDSIQKINFVYGNTPKLPDPSSDKEDPTWWAKGWADPPVRDESTKPPPRA
ncbi:hypothetical protein DE146DRAFT_775905 [Phaeosphaeria sp. MPI-PUGE-AT-0046c]|nr:hypothetical protein DE146DRAFT_775905 [Phaeosphaeria sp. MPI-PUGE-AT-0046c]